MRNLVTTAVAVALMTVPAYPQYKTPQPAPPGRTPGGVQVAPNPNVQISMPTVDDELAKAKRISRDEAMRMVTQKKAVYVDVRSKDSYDDGHIPGAISLPLSELQKRLKEVPLKKFLITYCA